VSSLPDIIPRDSGVTKGTWIDQKFRLKWNEVSRVLRKSGTGGKFYQAIGRTEMRQQL
jgi:hypothetical protein